MTRTITHHYNNQQPKKIDDHTKSKTPIKQARIASDLIELRNKSVFAFFMFNALFVLIVFLLQLNKDKLHIIWPLGVKTNITYDEVTAEVCYQFRILYISSLPSFNLHIFTS